MRKAGILIRDCSNYAGLSDGYYRIAVRKHDENLRLLQALEKSGRQIFMKTPGQNLSPGHLHHTTLVHLRAAGTCLQVHWRLLIMSIMAHLSGCLAAKKKVLPAKAIPR